MFKEEFDESIDDLKDEVENQKIVKLCKKVFSDVRSQYKTKYTFEEIVEDGLLYKIIPENFLFYRAYPKTDTPFPKRRPQVWVGFSFIDTISYATPQDKHFDEDIEKGRPQRSRTSENYCTLLGNVSTFKVKKQLKLLDMGNVQTVERLKEILNKDYPYKKDVLKGLDEGWKIEVKNGKEFIKRKSEYEGDSAFADWLYESGYDGYIGYNLPGLHDECCISRDKSLEYIEEEIKGMGLKFPLELLNSFPMTETVPICQYPFTKINYLISLD